MRVTHQRIVSNSDAQFSFAQGNLTIGGQVQLTDGGANSFNHAQFQPASVFSMDLYNNSDSTALNLQNANALTSQTGNVANKIDFFNIVVPGGTGIATVNCTVFYRNQEVYNYIAGSTTVDAIIDNSGFSSGDGGVYENLGFSGSGTKTVDGAATAPTLIVAQNVILGAGTETVDLSANNSALVVGANFTTGTGSTLTCGTGFFYLGGSFSNSGTCNFGTAAVTFNSGGVNTLYTVNPQLLTNVTIDGDSDEFITTPGGSFVLTSAGVLTLNGTSTVLHTNGLLTLNSDSTGSATIAAIPTGCGITGNVNVQRYITGGPDAFGGNGNRGYRLLSSPVYTAIDTAHNSNKIYSINYLLNSTYISGTNFPPTSTTPTSKTGNPSLYLYRESLLPQYTTFLNSNFRGINNISSPPNYMIDIDGGPYNIPVGNGYLFFFRGGIGTVNPFSTTAMPLSATLTCTGTLNQGTINAVHWYTPGSPNLSYTVSEAGEPFQGFNLVGNPYASSIDWDKFSSTDNTAPIYGFDVNNYLYRLVPGGAAGAGNYNVYTTQFGGINGATHVIPSGEGFFVIAGGTDATLTFSETAKIDSQVTGAILLRANGFRI